MEMVIVNPYAAGIDVSDKEHVVAVPEGVTTERVRNFGTMTCDLASIVEWLKPMELELYQQKYKQAKIAFLERKLLQLKKEVA